MTILQSCAFLCVGAECFVTSCQEFDDLLSGPFSHVARQPENRR